MVGAGDCDGRITGLAVALPNGVGRGGVDDVVAVEGDDRVPDVRLNFEKGVAGPGLRPLGDVGDIECSVATVLEIGLGAFAVRADDEYHLSHGRRLEFRHDVISVDFRLVTSALVGSR